jgi:hypothetical protein
MTKEAEEKSSAGGVEPSTGSDLARILAILGINLFAVVLAVVVASSDHGSLPDLNARTLAVHLLPVSAAMGLLLACRRLDLALPAVLALAVVLRNGPPRWFPDDPSLRVASLCGLCAGIGLASAVVTWSGRIASALWTALLAIGLWLLAQQMTGLLPSSGEWPWPAALSASLGLLVVGAAVMGMTGLVALPGTPPIIRSGSRGLAGLMTAWMLAGVAVALAAQSESIRSLADKPLEAYPPVLAAAAMGGAYILRGRFGAAAAIALTAVGHLVWAFIWSADLGSPLADLVVPAAVPLVCLPLYLGIDWTIRRSTGESPPTGLMA